MGEAEILAKYPPEKIIQMPPDLAIRVLNELSYPTLENLFDTNPVLKNHYRKLYEEGFRESKKISDPKVKSEALAITAGVLVSDRTLTTYYKSNVLGLIDPRLVQYMKLMHPVKLRDSDGSIFVDVDTVSSEIRTSGIPTVSPEERVIGTMDLLISWWLTYAGLNNLFDSEGQIHPNSDMNLLLSEKYAKVGIQPNSPFPPSKLSNLLQQYFEARPDLEHRLSLEQKNRLYQMATSLRDQLKYYSEQLQRSRPVQDYLTTVLADITSDQNL